jgi:hypothetical protein
LKAMFLIAVAILGVLLVPPLLFLAVFGAHLGSGHPPAIIIPYVYLLFGVRFVAPVGATLAFGATWLAFSRRTSPRWRYGALALGISLGVASVCAWRYDFK